MIIADLILAFDQNNNVYTVYWTQRENILNFLSDAQFPHNITSQCSESDGFFTAHGKTYFYQWGNHPNGTRIFLLKEKDASVTLLEKALDKVDDGIQIYDTETKLQYINHTSKTISGFHCPTEDLLQKN